MTQLTSSVDPGQLEPKSSTREFGRNGLAGVVKKQINLLQPTVEQMTNFLTDCYREGNGYSTINAFCTAISTTVDSVLGL